MGVAPPGVFGSAKREQLYQETRRKGLGLGVAVVGFGEMSKPTKRWWIVFLLVATVYAALTHARVFTAGNDASRWAQIEAIVDYGETTIERSRFGGTVDRVQVGGKVYSNKPPLFALVGAALYAPLSAATGWSLSDGASAARVVWLLTVLLVALPAAAAVATFDWGLVRFGALSSRRRAYLGVALGLGTLLFSYSGTLNSHVPAATLLLVAWFATLAAKPFAAGLAAGFAGAVDLLPGFGMAPFFALALPREIGGERRLRRFAAGLVPGVASFLLANFAVTGSLLTPKLLPGAVDLSAQVGASVGGVVLPERASYPLEVLLGGHGLFGASPVLLLGLVGLGIACRRPPFGMSGSSASWRLLALGLTAQIVGHALLAGSYGGWAFGYRYLLPVQPLLLYAAPVALARIRLPRTLILLLAVSIAFSALGAYHPWPPAFEQASGRDPVAALVTNPIGGNAAALGARYFPGSWLAELLGRTFVSPDPALRRRYFVYFFGSKGDLATMRRFEP